MRGRRDRNGSDDGLRVARAQGSYRCAKRRAGGQPVVHQDNGLPAYIGQCSTGTIQRNAPIYLGPLSLGDSRDDTAWDADVPSHRVLDDPTTVLGNGPECNLRQTGNTKFSSDYYIERRVEHIGHRACNGDTAARQRKHEKVAAAVGRAQGTAEYLAGSVPISEKR